MSNQREANRKPKTEEERLKRMRDKEIRKMLGLSRIGRNNV